MFCYVSGGKILPAAQTNSKSYSRKVIYENVQGKQVGAVTIKAPTSTRFDAAMNNPLAEEYLETAIGWVGPHDNSEDSFTVTLQCHAANCEIFNFRFS